MRAAGKDARAGVTLIEILIAVSLLSLLSAGILIAMHLGLATMEKTDSRLIKNRRVVNARKIIESEIDGFIFSMANFNPQPSTFQQVPFLQAEPQSMRFVSSYSLQDSWRGRAQITVLQVIPGENNQGVRLIVNEIPWTGPVQAGQSIISLEPDASGQPIAHFAPVTPGSQSFVLADKLRYCRFSYLIALPPPQLQAWSPVWATSQKLPLGIRIDMAPLDPTPTDLHVTTVTMRLNVNRTPGGTYAN